MGHVSAQEFLNKYNILDAYLRDIVGADESKGMVSLYKDTLDDPEEQMQLKTMNKLRNEIAHGVFPSNEPIKVDKSFVTLLDKHIDYVRTHQKEVKKKMQISILNRREKDERKEIAKSNHHIKETKKAKTYHLPFRNVVVSNSTGMLSFEDGGEFYSEFEYSIKNDTLYIKGATGVGRVILPPGQYDTFTVKNTTGNLMIMTHKAKFSNYQRNKITGMFHIAKKSK